MLIKLTGMYDDEVQRDVLIQSTDIVLAAAIVLNSVEVTKITLRSLLTAPIYVSESPSDILKIETETRRKWAAL